MKISGGADVFLKTDYDNLESFDKVFISKVFTDTPIDDKILHLENVQYGGTGFFYDLAPKLPDEIEHIFPDYHLYDDWVSQQIENGVKPIEILHRLFNRLFDQRMFSAMPVLCESQL